MIEKQYRYKPSTCECDFDIKFTFDNEEDQTPEESLVNYFSKCQSHSNLNDQEAFNAALLLNRQTNEANALINNFTQKINASIEFGNQLIKDYAIANVMLGITQAGKTKVVAMLMRDLVYFCQTGSLYEVMNEVDRIIAEEDLSQVTPFVTVEKLNQFKQKVQTFLSS